MDINSILLELVNAKNNLVDRITAPPQQQIDRMTQELQSLVNSDPMTLLQASLGGGGAGVIKHMTAETAGKIYANVPRTLMGYTNSGINKGFTEVAYKHIVPIKVEFLDDSGKVIDSMYEAMNGLNQSHALARANINWTGDVRGAKDVKITPIAKEELQKIDPELYSRLYK